jgi:predicted RNA-binding protein YlqC (UPF0109 family)
VSDAPEDVEELDEDVEDDEGEDDDEDRGNRVPGATATGVLEYLVDALVEDTDSVEIDVDGGRTLHLRVHVAPDDMGRVIGKRGRVANSIRSVVRAAAVRDRVEVDVDFVD